MRNLSFVDQLLILCPLVIGIFLPSPSIWYAQSIGLPADQLPSTGQTILNSLLSFLPFLLITFSLALATFVGEYSVKARVFLLVGGFVGLFSILLPGEQAMVTQAPEVQQLAVWLLPLMTTITTGLGLLVSWVMIRYFWLRK